MAEWKRLRELGFTLFLYYQYLRYTDADGDIVSAAGFRVCSLKVGNNLVEVRA